jgi:hypothetical protein
VPTRQAKLPNGHASTGVDVHLRARLNDPTSLVQRGIDLLAG